MRETHELKVVVSSRISILRREQYCAACGLYLGIGEKIYSYGIIDRKHREWSREYYCDDHCMLLDNTNTEDLPEFEQNYLIEKGFANEFYRRG